MNRLRHVVIVATAIVVTTTHTAASGTTVSPAIQKYIDADTAFVGWVDITQIDIAGLQKFLQMSGGPGINNPNALASIQRALVELNVTRLYLLADLATLENHGPSSFLLETDKADTAHLLLSTLAAENNNVVEREGDVVLAASNQREMDRLKSVQGAAPTALISAVNRIRAPHGLVFEPSAREKAAAINSLPRLIDKDDVQAVASMAEAIVNLQTVSLAGTLPPSEASLEIRAKTATAAQAIADLSNRLCERLAPGRAAHFRLKVEDTHAQWTGDSLAEVKSALATVQTIAATDIRPPANSLRSLKQIALAQHNFHDVYSHFAPQSLISDDGERLLSWRVLVLPYLDEAPLYEKFRLDEPWDSPHNQQLIKEMPPIYASKTSPELTKQGRTRFVTLLTENSVFGRRGAATPMYNIIDGTSNTILCVEAGASKAVAWTKPEDLTVDLQKPLASIIDEGDDHFHGCLCDGAAYKFPATLSAKQLKALISMNGRETVEPF